MTMRRLLLPLCALAWGTVAAVVVGAPRLDGLMAWLSGSATAPSAGAVAGLVVWSAAMVLTAFAVVDSLPAMRLRRVVTLPRLLVVAGAVLLVLGGVAQLSSDRVCCSPPDVASSR